MHRFRCQRVLKIELSILPSSVITTCSAPMDGSRDVASSKKKICKIWVWREMVAVRGAPNGARCSASLGNSYVEHRLVVI